MTKTNGHLRAAFEEVTREDLRLLREALLRPTAAEHTFLSKLSHSLLADLEFFTDSSEQLRYQIQWMERGRLRKHEANANTVITEAGRRCVLLDDLPSSIEPLGMLEGDFEHEFFPAHRQSFELPSAAPEVRRRSAYDLQFDENEFPLTLGAASEDDGFDYTEQEEDFLALGAASFDEDEDEELLDLAAGTPEETKLWTITWPANGDLAIAYHPQHRPEFEELPAIVSVDYLDDDGNKHQYESFVCLEQSSDGQLTARSQSIDRRDLPYPGDGTWVNFSIRPVTKNDVLRVDEDNLSANDRIMSASYLANCQFEAFNARSSMDAPNQISFRGIDEHFPRAEKSYACKFVSKAPEADGVDEAPFDEERSDRIEKMLLLVSDRFLKDYLDNLKTPGLIGERKIEYLNGVALWLVQSQLENFERIKESDGLRSLRQYFTKSFSRELSKMHRASTPAYLASTSAEETASAFNPKDRVDHTLVLDWVEFGKLEPMLDEFLDSQRAAGVDEIALQAFTRKWQKKSNGRSEISDQALAEQLNADFGCNLNGDNVNDMRLRVWKHCRLFGVSKRIFRNSTGSKPLLDGTEFERLQARLAGAKRGTSMADLKIDVSLASLSLRGESLITEEDLLFAEEWLLRGLEMEDLASMFGRTDIELEKWFGWLGVSLHAQILRDHGKYSKWTSRFLHHWLLKHEPLEKAANATRFEIQHNKARQEENRRRDEAKSDSSELDRPTASNTKDFDLNHCIQELTAYWEKSKTLVPEHYRQLPSMC